MPRLAGEAVSVSRRSPAGDEFIIRKNCYMVKDYCLDGKKYTKIEKYGLYTKNNWYII